MNSSSLNSNSIKQTLQSGLRESYSIVEEHRIEGQSLFILGRD
jgi:hypothetical protein